MSWIKLDDNIIRHPKLVALDPKQRWFWLAAVCYANKYGTDGHIAEHVIPHLDDLHTPVQARRAAAALEDAGLWHRNGAGYDIHDYLDYQPSGEELRNRRQAAAERQRRFRTRNDAKRQRNDRDSTEIRQRFDEESTEIRDRIVQGPQGESGRSNGVTNAPPTRPDPTRERFSPSVTHTISESQEGANTSDGGGGGAPASPPQDTDPVFAELWERWPKQYGKRAAYQALRHQARTYGASWSAGDVVAGIVNFADGFDRDPRYCPALARFLEDELWREHQQPTPTSEDKIKAAIDAAFGPEEPEPE